MIMEIVCKFKELKELEPGLIREKDTRTKCGRYEGGILNVKGFGYDKWTVAAYIITDKPLKKYISQGLSEQQIVEGCLKHLNKPPTKRSKKFKYGNLECRHFIFMEEMITVSLITDQRNSKYFWGRGRTTKQRKIHSNRGRPRKKK
jgi:hypothetical protein